MNLIGLPNQVLRRKSSISCTNLLNPEQASVEVDVLTAFGQIRDNSISIDTNEHKFGTKSCKCLNNSAGDLQINTLPVPVTNLISGQEYCFSVYITSTATAKTLTPYIAWNNSTYSTPSSNPSASNEFERIDVTGLCPVGANGCYVGVQLNNGDLNDVIWWDGAMLNVGDTPLPFCIKQV